MKLTIQELIDLLNDVENKNREVYFYESYYDCDVINVNEYSIEIDETVSYENADAPRFGIRLNKR